MAYLICISKIHVLVKKELFFSFTLLFVSNDQIESVFSVRRSLHAFLLSTEFFSKLIFPKNSFWNTITVSNSLDPGQA